MPRISVIIPVLNESERISAHLALLREQGPANLEIIVVDGGSSDATFELAQKSADLVLRSVPGRAKQMNLGAERASGDILLFLHVDSRLPEDFAMLLGDDFWPSSHQWGRFDVRLSGANPMFRVIELFINLRSRLTGIATGDQAIFVRRTLFSKMGGYRPLPLMEDIEISGQLRQSSRPWCFKSPVVSSSRKWESEGVVRTILMMWYLRVAFWMGRDPGKLAGIYYGTR